jgi:predicted DNA-binding transcriptional regulator YafY
MRASRLLSILLLLQTRGRMSAQALADEFEVSVRTIYRDVDDLSAAGVPVYAERGRAGGFQLLDGYRTRLTGMTQTEVEALMLSGLPGPAAELGLGQAMAAAQLKLVAALPHERREEAGRISARFHLDPMGWYQHAERADLVPLLADAVWNERRIRVRYESWKATVDRELEPLGIAMKGGVWYLVARAGGKPRTYRVSNIHELDVTDQRFARPPRFDLAAYWSEWSKEFEARLYMDTATVRFSPRVMQKLHHLAPAVAASVRKTARKPDKKGWVRADIPIESVSHAAGEMLKFGADVEVIAPEALRERLRDISADLGALYAQAKAPRTRATKA